MKRIIIERIIIAVVFVAIAVFLLWFGCRADPRLWL